MLVIVVLIMMTGIYVFLVILGIVMAIDVAIMVIMAFLCCALQNCWSYGGSIDGDRDGDGGDDILYFGDDSNLGGGDDNSGGKDSIVTGDNYIGD